MAIREREPLDNDMDVGAHLENDYHDQSIVRLCLVFIYRGSSRVVTYLPKNRGIKLRDKLIELYPLEG